MKRIILSLIAILSLSPIIAFAQSAQGQGIFACSTGQYVQSVGSQTATASIYVPVADATVELNTGILVYKECILRNIVDRIRESVTAGLIRLNQNTIDTGRDGSAYYVVNMPKELIAANDAAAIPAMQNGLGNLSDAFKTRVQSYVSRGYALATRSADSALKCDYQGDLSSALNGTTDDVYGALSAEADPACNPSGARLLAYNYVMDDAAAAGAYQQQQWNWNGGWYSRTDGTANPLDSNIVTPGTLINAISTQGITSGFRQVENANDIGQMIGALFAGLGTQVMTSQQGLAGISNPTAGQSSYLSQVLSQAQSGLQNSINTAALAFLQSALQIEQQYNRIISSIASTLSQTAATLQGNESTCWGLIIQHVCSASSTQAGVGSTCQDVNGTTLFIATSTAFSQALIQAQIAPYASSTAQSLSASQQSLSLITRLINSVSNSSADAQQIAVQQVNQLIAQGALHTQSDLTSIAQTQQSLSTTMQNLLTNSAQNWSQGNPNTSNPYDPNSGWCNINNQTTLQMWDHVWQRQP